MSVINTDAHLISLKLAHLQNDDSSLSSYLMQTDLAKLKSVVQVQGNTIKIILFAKDVLFFCKKNDLNYVHIILAALEPVIRPSNTL